MSRYLSDEVALTLAVAPALFLPLMAFLNSDSPQPNPTPPSRCENVSEKLDSKLCALSVRGYERLIARLLQMAGYEDVHVLRDHRILRHSHKGRNRHGGVDITAMTRAEFGTTPILVQVKQYRRPVSRRFVDELRGALLRTQARQGLLITTSTFSPAAKEAARYDFIGPIHLIKGQQLRELLITHRLGVKQNGKGRLVVQSRFFRRLDKLPGENATLDNPTGTKSANEPAR